MKNNKIAGLGLAGLMGLSGCSAVLGGASMYSRSRDVYNALQTGAAIANIHEENERANNTGIRGMDNIADAIRDNNGNNQNGQQLPDNPLLWDLSNSDLNGEKIAFSQRVGAEGSEIYIMDNDGKNLKRLTFDNVVDVNPYWAGDWVVWVCIPDVNNVSVKYFNAVTGERGEEKIVLHNWGKSHQKIIDRLKGS